MAMLRCQSFITGKNTKKEVTVATHSFTAFLKSVKVAIPIQIDREFFMMLSYH